MAVAFAFMLVGAAYLLAPEATAIASPVGRDLGIFEIVWSALYVLGGASIIYALARPSARARVAGLALLATGLLMNGIGAATFELTLRVPIYFVYFLACASRAYTVAWHLRHPAGG